MIFTTVERMSVYHDECMIVCYTVWWAAIGVEVFQRVVYFDGRHNRVSSLTSGDYDGIKGKTWVLK